MKDTNNKYKHLFYQISYSLLLCISVLLGLGAFIGTGQVTGTKLILIVLILSFLGMIQVGGIRLRSVCVIALVVCAMMLLFIYGMKNVSEFIYTYFGWLLHKEWKDEWATGYQLIQVGWVTFGCYALQILIDRVFTLQIGISLAFAFYLLYGMFTNQSYLQITVAMMTGYIVLTFVEYAEKHWKKVKSQDSKLYMVWLCPFFIIYILLLTVTPVSEKPYDWKLAKKIYTSVKENFTILYENLTRNDREDFEFAVSGFSEDGRFMSGLIPDNREIMTIQGKQNLKTNVYLTGKVYDTFHGQEWIQTQQISQQDRLIDALETLYAVNYLDHSLEQNYLKSTQLDIRYGHFNTGYVFAPLKTWKVQGISYESTNTGLLLKEKKGYATEYSSMFYQMNVDHPVFYEMMEKDIVQDEAIWNSVLDYVKVEKTDCSFEDLKAYQKVVHLIYEDELSLSEELENYIEEVTRDAVTPLQRLQSIEKELAGYTYTLNPGKLPDEVTTEESFLEYFLLDSKKGYCSHFATAFVLLARKEGFPARYVEGFCVPINEQKQVTVYSNMAHAWPEVYFDGIGWIPFEPTPGYANIRYTPWELAVPRSAQEDVKPDYLYEPDLEDEAMEVEQLPGGEIRSRRSILSIVGVAVVCILCFSIAVLAVERSIRKKKQQALSTQERFLLTLQMQFKIMKKMGVIRENTQTLQDFQMQTLQPFLEQHELSLTSFQTISVYEDYLYGKREITKELLLQAQSELLVWMKLLKKEKRWYYLIYRSYI